MTQNGVPLRIKCRRFNSPYLENKPVDFAIVFGCFCVFVLIIVSQIPYLGATVAYTIDYSHLQLVSVAISHNINEYFTNIMHVFEHSIAENNCIQINLIKHGNLLE